MSKQCKKVEQLRLDSTNWMPVPEAHRRLTGLVGDPDLAAKDLTAAVADQRLPCMQRAIASHIAPDQDRKIVPLSFWDKYEFGFDPVNGLKVCRKNRFPAFPGVSRRLPNPRRVLRLETEVRKNLAGASGVGLGKIIPGGD
jgi:hypothetical protein